MASKFSKKELLKEIKRLQKLCKEIKDDELVCLKCGEITKIVKDKFGILSRYVCYCDCDD